MLRCWLVGVLIGINQCALALGDPLDWVDGKRLPVVVRHYSVVVVIATPTTCEAKVDGGGYTSLELDEEPAGQYRGLLSAC